MMAAPKQPLRLEDSLAVQFSRKFRETLTAVVAGDLLTAFNICDDVLNRPDIDDYRKAMFTLFLAHAIIYDTAKSMNFAKGTLNILQRIRTGYCGYSEHGVAEMESQVNELILCLEMDKLVLSSEGQGNTCGVSLEIEMEKAANAVMKMEMVLDPDYRLSGLHREHDGAGGRGVEVYGNREDFESDAMDCD